MEEKPSEEFDGIQGHRPLPVAALIVFPPKRHLALLESQEAASRDGDTMRVARQIPEHGLGASHRGLRIDDPRHLL